MENSKTYYKLKIDAEDYPYIAKAFITASNLLLAQYPEKKRGRESQYTKDLRKKNVDFAFELTDAMNRVLYKYPQYEIIREEKTES